MRRSGQPNPPRIQTCRQSEQGIPGAQKQRLQRRASWTEPVSATTGESLSKMGNQSDRPKSRPAARRDTSATSALATPMVVLNGVGRVARIAPSWAGEVRSEHLSVVASTRCVIRQALIRQDFCRIAVGDQDAPALGLAGGIGRPQPPPETPVSGHLPTGGGGSPTGPCWKGIRFSQEPTTDVPATRMPQPTQRAHSPLATSSRYRLQNLQP